MSISMEQITQLAKTLLEADKKISLVEEELRKVKAHGRQLREETIPSAMQELGLASIKLSTGQTLTIKQDVYASIPEDNKTQAFGWLEEHGDGDLIKSIVKINFGRGELVEAGKLVDQLENRGMEPQFDERIHPQTLKAWLRDKISRGISVPLDLFGARPVWIATIK